MSWLTNLIELLFGKPPQRKRKATEPEKDTVATPIEDLEPKGAPGNKPYGDVAASAQVGHAKTEARTPAPSSAIVEAAGAFSPEVVILVPEFKNDREAGFTNRVLETLRAARMLNVRSVERGISSPGDRPNVAKLALFYAEARAALHEQSADVLLYGEVLRNGLRMRMVSAVPSGEARMGDFGIGDALMVPHNFGSELANLVYAGVLAAALPAKPVSTRARRLSSSSITKTLLPRVPCSHQTPGTTQSAISVPLCVPRCRCAHSRALSRL